MAQDGIAYGAHEAVSQLISPRWLIQCNETCTQMRGRGERPEGLAPGRWLGDYLDQETPSGLLPAEEGLLHAAISGEACRLQNRATRLWSAFEAWRDTVPESFTPTETSFTAAMTAFLNEAPEAVREVMEAASRHAYQKLGVDEDWEPQNAEDTRRLAAAQQCYFTRLKIEASPDFAASLRNSKSFFPFCSQVVIEALSNRKRVPPTPADGCSISRNEPLNVYAETRQKVDAQPRPLRGFFGELARYVRAARESDPVYLVKLKNSPGLLRPHFDAVWTRYLRECWRWVDAADPETCLRADFIRFLCLGGDEMAPAHERGLDLDGAYITGDLDLTGCAVSRPLSFSRCDFDGHVGLGLANLRSLSLEGSRVRSLDAPYLSVRGNLLLRDGFRAKRIALNHASIKGSLLLGGAALFAEDTAALDCTGAAITGDADFSGAFMANGAVLFDAVKIAGNLICHTGKFCHRGESGLVAALSGCDAVIAGNVELTGGFRSEGAVAFRGATIGGRLNCNGGSFENRTRIGTGRALDCEESTIGRDVSLTPFLAGGEVNFARAQIGSSFVCDGDIDNTASHPLDGREPCALSLEDARIDGPLVLGEAPSLTGSLVLTGCRAGELVISPQFRFAPFQKTPDGKRQHFYNYLDRLTYNRVTLGGNSIADAAKTLLRRQPPNDLRADFKPQPFDQLFKVYREAGHTRDARRIAKFKARFRYRSRFTKLWQGLFNEPGDMRRLFGRNWLTSAFDWFDWGPAILLRAIARILGSIPLAIEWAVVAFGTAYWHGWGRLAAFLVALWLGGGLFYLTAASQDAFVPAHPALALNKELQNKCRLDWPSCKAAIPELAEFKPFTYSAEIMLPVLNSGQRRDWRPAERTDKPLEIQVPVLHWLSDEEVVELGASELTLPGGSLQHFTALQAFLSLTAFGLLIATLFKRD